MTLNYKSFGTGPALIILHGLLGSLDNWLTLAKRLAENYTVFIIDQRNHGKSPHDNQWDYPIMAEDLHEFMEQQGIFISHILGHSMGGKTAMQFAGMYPNRIEKLIVADMGIKRNSPSHTQILEGLNHINLSTLTSRQEADQQLASYIPSMPIRQFLIKNLSKDTSGEFAWKFNLNTITQEYENILAAVKIDQPFDHPTLFITGGKSDYVSQADHESIKAYFPEVRFAEIPEAGHWLHAEAPDEFLRIVREFLG